MTVNKSVEIKGSTTTVSSSDPIVKQPMGGGASKLLGGDTPTPGAAKLMGTTGMPSKVAATTAGASLSKPIVETAKSITDTSAETSKLPKMFSTNTVGVARPNVASAPRPPNASVPVKLLGDVPKNIAPTTSRGGASKLLGEVPANIAPTTSGGGASKLLGTNPLTSGNPDTTTPTPSGSGGGAAKLLGKGSTTPPKDPSGKDSSLVKVNM